MWSALKAKTKILLLWIQKYTKTDMVYVASGGFWLLAGQFSSAGIGFISSLFFANLLDPVVFGTYRYILTLAEVLAVFSLSGLDFAVVSSVARGYYGVLRSAFLTNLRWSTLMVIAAWGASGYYYLRGNETLSVSLLFLGMALPFLTSANLLGPFLDGKKEFRKRVSYEMANNATRTAAVILAIFYTKNPAVLAIIYLGVQTVFALWSYARVVRIFRLPREHHADTIRLGKHWSIINVIGVIGEHIDKLLIFQYLGAAELAIYSFALLIPDQGRNVLKKIITLAMPKMATKKNSEIKKSIFKRLYQSSFILIPCTVLYIIVAPFIYKFFYPQYVAAIPLSQFFALTFLLYGNLGMPAIIAKGMVKEKYIADIVPTVVRIIMMALLIAPYGIWGVLISKVFTKWLGNVLVLILIKRMKTED